jgi:hypothetical protein
VINGEAVLLGVARRVDGIHLAPLLEALVSKHRRGARILFVRAR